MLSYLCLIVFAGGFYTLVISMFYFLFYLYWLTLFIYYYCWVFLLSYCVMCLLAILLFSIALLYTIFVLNYAWFMFDCMPMSDVSYFWIPIDIIYLCSSMLTYLMLLLAYYFCSLAPTVVSVLFVLLILCIFLLFYFWSWIVLIVLLWDFSIDDGILGLSFVYFLGRGISWLD